MNPNQRQNAFRVVTAVAIFSSLLSGGCETSPTAPAPMGARPTPRADAVVPDAQPASDPVIARVENVRITRSQLISPLIESHGLSTLLNLVQLSMAEQDATRQGITVSDADVQAEEDRTLSRMFKETVSSNGADEPADPSEYPALLEQFLQRRNMTRADWRLLMRINATLRKLAEPRARGAIRDEQLDEAYRLLYGEKAQVRHIQCSNLQEIAEARRRLDAGEPFEDVARALSRNPRTGPLGGEMPPFTRQSAFPQAFKDAAFALQPGQVSDPVMAENAYHLIKLERLIEPTLIKFEDVKDAIRDDLEEKLVQQWIVEIRTNLSERAAQGLRIDEPALRDQFRVEQARREQQIRDREQIQRELERQRERAAEQGIPDLPPPPAATQP